MENSDKVQGAKVEGYLPTPDTIASSKYPIARSLFFYIKNSHAEKVPAMSKYVNMFMSEDMIGRDSILGEIGLIALPDATRTSIRASVAKRTKITLEELSKKH